MARTIGCDGRKPFSYPRRSPQRWLTALASLALVGLAIFLPTLMVAVIPLLLLAVFIIVMLAVIVFVVRAAWGTANARMTLAGGAGAKDARDFLVG